MEHFGFSWFLVLVVLISGDLVLVCGFWFLFSGSLIPSPFTNPLPGRWPLTRTVYFIECPSLALAITLEMGLIISNGTCHIWNVLNIFACLQWLVNYIRTKFIPHIDVSVDAFILCVSSVFQNQSWFFCHQKRDQRQKGMRMLRI